MKIKYLTFFLLLMFCSSPEIENIKMVEEKLKCQSLLFNSGPHLENKIDKTLPNTMSQFDIFAGKKCRALRLTNLI